MEVTRKHQKPSFVTRRRPAHSRYAGRLYHASSRYRRSLAAIPVQWFATTNQSQSIFTHSAAAQGFTRAELPGYKLLTFTATCYRLTSAVAKADQLQSIPTLLPFTLAQKLTREKLTFYHLLGLPPSLKKAARFLRTETARQKPLPLSTLVYPILLYPAPIPSPAQHKGSTSGDQIPNHGSPGPPETSRRAASPPLLPGIHGPNQKLVGQKSRVKSFTI
jgi:hypothetical protein